MPDLNVSVIITNYNGKNLLEENLPAVVSARENPSNKIIEILVVDDASTDKSVSFLKSDFPGVRVISHRQNRGFAAATNTGVRMAKGKLVCLLNNDVSPSPNFLESVFQIFEKKRALLVFLFMKKVMVLPPAFLKAVLLFIVLYLN